MPSRHSSTRYLQCFFNRSKPEHCARVSHDLCELIVDAPSRRTLMHWTLPRLMGTRWSRTVFLSILVGLLSGLAARALESLVDLGFPRLTG
jgi:hypothetical protein